MKRIVVLDMDGVLVDTIPELFRIFQEFMSERGQAVGEGDFSRYNGMKLHSIIEDLRVRYRLPDNHDDMFIDYSNRMGAIYNHAKLMDGALEFLSFCLDHNISICIASGSNRQNIELILSRFALSGFISFYVGGDEVSKAKPDPEIYHKIFSHYGPADYLVIDDSLNGIAGARAARMNALLFANKPYPGEKTVPGFYVLQSFICGQILSSEISSSEVLVDIVGSFTFDKLLTDAFWNNFCLSNPKAFNGPQLIICNFRLEGDKFKIEARSTDFATLKTIQEFQVRPFSLAVSGVVHWNQMVLLGKRASWLDSYPGALELVPSGSLTGQKSPGDHLLDELEEETSLNRKNVEAITFKGLITDEKLSCLDVIFEVILKEDAAPKASDEYDTLNFLTVDEAIQRSLVPSSEKILQLFR